MGRVRLAIMLPVVLVLAAAAAYAAGMAKSAPAGTKWEYLVVKATDLNSAGLRVGGDLLYWRARDAAQPPPYGFTYWQPPGPDKTCPDGYVTTALNRAGAEGWELMGIWNGDVLIFKRPLP